MMVAAAATPNPKSSTRPPLVPPEGGDNVAAPLRLPKFREVGSRYMATPISRRCPSPSVSRTATVGTPGTPMPTRSQSAERRRPVTPRPSTSNVGEAAKMLLTSTRSMSVSFQGEAFPLRVSKVKPAPVANASPSLRQGTPERRKATPLRGGTGQRENSNSNTKAMDQHRWPARLRQGNSLSRSLDYTDERRKKADGSGNVVIRALQSSLIDDRSRNYTDLVDANSAIVREGSATIPVDFSVASDAESVSSGSTSGAQELGGGVSGRGRGVNVSARWQETNIRLRQGRSSEASSPQSKSMALKTATGATPKITLPKKMMDTPVLSPRTISTNRGSASPVRGSSIRPASPSKFSTPAVSSPARGTSPARTRGVSPARTRNGVAGTLGSNLSNVPSIHTFAADIRRGKMGENRIVDAHQLRLLHNRLLQWRYVNARADATNLAQTVTAEKILYNASMTMSKLRDSVRDKRIMLQMLRQNTKLTSILKEQMPYLEEWAIMDRDHSNSLSGTVEAFKASTLRLPIVGGARAEVQNVKDAICSAAVVMQAMESSIHSLLSKVNSMNSLVSEVASVASKERVLLNELKNLLSTIEAMQVKDCSLRTHTLQLHRLP